MVSLLVMSYRSGRFLTLYEMLSIWNVSLSYTSRRYMAEILPIRRKIQSNESNNHIIQHIINPRPQADGNNKSTNNDV